MPKCLQPAFTLFLTSFWNSEQLCSADNFFTFSPVLLLIQILYLASDEAFKKIHASLPDTSTWVKCAELGGHCFICRQFACRHCSATRAVCTEHHASHWICRSVRQQSIAVFIKICKHKLINSFNYCLQKITAQWHRCRIKLVLVFFVEKNENN